MLPRTPLRALLFIGVAGIVAVRDSSACTVGPRTPEVLVREADLIVRARASSSEVVPARAGIGTEHLVRFIVLEQLKGPHLFDVVARGTLSDRLQMKRAPMQYPIVKPSGLGGSCYATTYQTDGEYLLFLKTINGVVTPYWAPSSATNEQIAGPQDEWVLWVKEQLLLVAKTIK
jgi:hypothetical protein